MSRKMSLKTFLESEPRSLLSAMEAFERAGDEGRQASFHWENGQLVHLWVGKQPNRLQGRCSARCRDGHACLRRVAKGAKRCRNHGGLSTGPKTAEGRAAIAESNRKRAENKQKHEAKQAEEIRRGREVLEIMDQRIAAGLPILP